MREPSAYLEYAPRGPGLLCAVVLFPEEKNVYGWYTGVQGELFPAVFFMLEDYYSTRTTVFYQSEEDDVHGDWAIIDADGGLKLEQPVPVAEELCHELEHMQHVFAREWLFYADDPASLLELALSQKENLPFGPVNVKHRKLNKFVRLATLWTYSTPGMDLNVIEFLKARWPLDCSA